MERCIRAIEDLDKLEPIESMSKIGVDSIANMVYYVNPNWMNRVREPYFEVYDNISHPKATHIARISFLESRYITHRDEAGKQPWKLNSSEKKQLMTYLNKQSGLVRITNWVYSMYLWNYEYGFFDNIEIDDTKYSNVVEAFADGLYDIDENIRHPSYLPSCLIMPDYTQL